MQNLPDGILGNPVCLGILQIRGEIKLYCYANTFKACYILGEGYPVPGVQIVEHERKIKRVKEREKRGETGKEDKNPVLFPSIPLFFFSLFRSLYFLLALLYLIAWNRLGKGLPHFFFGPNQGPQGVEKFLQSRPLHCCYYFKSWLSVSI